jgi:serine/threonine protein phosphatase PrpC
MRMTIGAFARAARLSAKALRLYDELGLLRPATVDERSGYRYYDGSQLERARLIAWLRRLGMPLARITRICELPAGASGAEIAAYWREVTAETESRGRLAAFLVDYLSGRGHVMSGTPMGVRYAARADAGPVRTTNEDAAYAGGRLWAVADGARDGDGDRASAAAVEAMRTLETREIAAGDLLNVLTEAVADADRAVGSTAGGVTTLTALLWTGPELGLVHIGDTRAYLLRDGELHQITHDHTQVQSLLDEGRLTPEEAESHPDRAMLTRALTGDGAAADVSVLTAVAGDRYLLCSDGLSTAVSVAELGTTLRHAASPDAAVAELISLAHAAGAPDNIACVVADIVPV